MTVRTAPSVLVVGESDPHGLSGSFLRAFRRVGCTAELFDYYGVARKGFSAYLRTRNRLASDTRPTPRDGPGRAASRAARALGDAARSGLSRAAQEIVAVVPFKGAAYQVGVSIVRPFQEYRILRAVRELRADLVFFVKCDDLHGTLYRALRRCRPRPVVAAFHPDDPFNVASLVRGGPSHRRAVAQAAWCDHYFLWSRELVERINRRTPGRASYLPFACDLDLYAEPGGPRVQATDERHDASCDVAFIGNWDRKRERWLDAFAGSGLRLAIWGEYYWRTQCSSEFVRRCWQGRAAYAAELRAWTERAPVSLNILRRQNEGAHNMRTFEIPACRGLLLSEWSEDQAAHFAPGREALYARDADEMVERARAAVRDGARAAAVREAGHARARASTYAERVRSILTVVGLEPREVGAGTA